MADGPGKYDDEAERVRVATNAAGVALVVIDGSKGNGVSCKGEWATHAEFARLLRMIADNIERDLARGPDAEGRHKTIPTKGRA